MKGMRLLPAILMLLLIRHCLTTRGKWCVGLN